MCIELAGGPANNGIIGLLWAHPSELAAFEVAIFFMWQYASGM